MPALSTYWWFLRSMRNSRIVWILACFWALLSAASTVSFLVPQVQDHVPRWHWYWWALGWQAVIVVAVFEGGYRYARLYSPDVIAKISSSQSAVLLSLPVRQETLRQELFAVCKGVRIDMSLYIFVKTKIVSTKDMGIFNVWIVVKDKSGQPSKGARLADLSKWILVEEFFDQRFNMKNTRDIPIEGISLRLDQLKAGMPVEGWIGFEIPRAGGGPPCGFEDAEELTLWIEDGAGKRAKPAFPPRDSWPPSNDRIIHATVRSLQAFS